MAQMPAAQLEWSEGLSILPFYCLLQWKIRVNSTKRNSTKRNSTFHEEIQRWLSKPDNCLRGIVFVCVCQSCFGQLRQTHLPAAGWTGGEMPDRRSVWQEDAELKTGLLCGRFRLCFHSFFCLLFSMLLRCELPGGKTDVFLCVCIASRIMVT